MARLNATHDPRRRSWIPSANQPETDFPIQNLPFGIFWYAGREPRGGVAIGDCIFDLSAAVEASLFVDHAAQAARAAAGSTLNPLMALGAGPVSALRAGLSDLLREDGPDRRSVEGIADSLLIPMTAAHMQLPATIYNFTDFVCSSFHALRIPRKPLDSSLPPVLSHMPVAYHGRASSVRISGGDVCRPNGQSKSPEGSVQFGPSKTLDFELEIGAFIGPGNALGSPIPIERAAAHVFGYCLLNDWSARDVQFWESMLGPFLSKSLSTTISPWVVTAEALEPFRTPIFRPSPDHPAPLPYLDFAADRLEGGMDIELEAYVQTSRMRQRGERPARIVTTNFRFAYWSLAQMVAHHTSNGCNLQPGDLLGSGTVSGPTDDARACLLEYESPLQLPNGEERQYLEDGDEVVLQARARREGYVPIGFGECRALITPALSGSADPADDAADARVTSDTPD
jgi:fumarylacetoacetase